MQNVSYEGDSSWRTALFIVWYHNTTMERVTGRDLTHMYCKPSWPLSLTKETQNNVWDIEISVEIQ